MMNFLKKNRINITVTIYLAMLGSFFYFLAFPLKEKIENKASDIQQEKIDQDITKKKIMTVPVMEKDYQKYKENEESLNTLVEPSQEVDFIKNLESLAEETGNKIEFKIQEVKAEPKTKKTNNEDIKGKLVYTSFLSMQIALVGDYKGFVNFLQKLENNKKYVNVLAIRSEKVFLEEEADQVKAVSQEAGGVEEKKKGKEVLNSILDVAVYIKK